MTRPIASLILVSLFLIALAVPQAQGRVYHGARATPLGMRTFTVHRGPFGRTVVKSNLYRGGRYIGHRTIIKGPLGVRVRHW